MKITLSAQVKKQKQIKNKKHHYTLLTVTQVNAHRKPMLPVDVMETENSQLLRRSSIPTTKYKARLYLWMLSQPISPGAVGLDAE